MDGGTLAARIAAVRQFSRFYTRAIGVLHEGLLGSPLSLTEARVIYELARRETATASALGAELGLDAGYLSRILRGFEGRGLIVKRPSEVDARQVILSLTETGRDMFARLDARSRAEVGALLERLPPTDQERLVAALGTAERLLAGDGSADPSYVLRPPRPGDMGWIVHRHGVLYAEEYGWDETFEAFVAQIAADFVRNFNAKRERCWIVEHGGAVAGSVLLVADNNETAKLRLLYVEPAARGLGIGKRLVAECIDFAARAGYRKLTLWTNDILVAARRIYEGAGFRLVREEPHHSFGRDLVGQYWELELAPCGVGRR